MLCKALAHLQQVLGKLAAEARPHVQLLQEEEPAGQWQQKISVAQ
jgi:hypothetical protein